MRLREAWTPELDAECKRLIDEGLSAAQVGVQLGRNRNAVIGRAHRKGWQLKQVQHRRPERIVPKPSRRHQLSVSAVAALASPMPELQQTAQQCEPRTLIELDDRMCHWPIDGATGLLYCGAVVDRVRYCAVHADMAARKMTK